MYKYFISGLRIESEHRLQLLECLTTNAAFAADVIIREFDIGHASLPKTAVPPGVVCFQAKRDLIFTVSKGCEIRIFRGKSITEHEIDLFLLGSAWGALCHQRGLFPLHCSAVSSGSDAFAFVAPSGGGKSTLAASLCGASLDHVCDDVAILDMDGPSDVTLRAMPKGLKLWGEAAAALGLECQKKVSSDQGINKYYVAPPKGPESSILELKAIYSLTFAGAECDTRIERLFGLDALKCAYRNVYRVEWLGTIGGADKVLANALVIADRIPVYRFTRPRALNEIRASASFLSEHMYSHKAQLSRSNVTHGSSI